MAATPRHVRTIALHKLSDQAVMSADDGMSVNAFPMDVRLVVLSIPRELDPDEVRAQAPDALEAAHRAELERVRWHAEGGAALWAHSRLVETTQTQEDPHGPH